MRKTWIKISAKIGTHADVRKTAQLAFVNWRNETADSKGKLKLIL